MSFDDEVDEVKREMQTAKLDPEARRTFGPEALRAAQGADRQPPFGLRARPRTMAIRSSQVKYKPENETLASVFVNEDGSITFQAAGASDEADDDDDDAGYFPSYVEYMDEEEFLEDAYDMLKVGLAEYEIDREQRG